MNELKQRHGCVTFWLWLVILANLGMALYYSVDMFNAYSSNMSLGLGLLAIIGVSNVLGAILLMRWNKRGFHLLLFGCLIGIIINLGILNLGIQTIFTSLFSVLIWWAILQIRKNGTSAWKLMNGGWDYKHCRHLYQVFIGIIIIILVLTAIAASENKNSNPYDYLYDDEDVSLVDSVAVEELVDSVAIEDDGIDWQVYTDDTNSASVEAPSEFRKLKLNNEQLMALGCSDYDPYIAIVKESKTSLDAVGVTTTKEYSSLIVKMMQNSGGTNFKKLNQQSYGKDSYLTEFEMDVDGTKFYYKVIACKTAKNFYYCQVLCIDKYKYKLKDQIDHIIDSFKALK